MATSTFLLCLFCYGSYLVWRQLLSLFQLSNWTVPLILILNDWQSVEETTFMNLCAFIRLNTSIELNLNETTTTKKHSQFNWIYWAIQKYCQVILDEWNFFYFKCMHDMVWFLTKCQLFTDFKYFVYFCIKIHSRETVISIEAGMSCMSDMTNS